MLLCSTNCPLMSCVRHEGGLREVWRKTRNIPTELCRKSKETARNWGNLPLGATGCYREQQGSWGVACSKALHGRAPLQDGNTSCGHKLVLLKIL
eukprot:TRINITY_DN70607_c0_g1_i1.p1 TRINITY_DN70607_c0_g1~~TRINITY_DN70607_c0_g1_i1.p1  ORF type:complete len:103 (+),score=2.66 TRINITY_DN70607_c0_g1_i1:27-311(+)